MKKSVLFFCMLFMSSIVFSQTTLFHENFELPSLADSVSIDSGGTNENINLKESYNFIPFARVNNIFEKYIQKLNLTKQILTLNK